MILARLHYKTNPQGQLQIYYDEYDLVIRIGQIKGFLFSQSIARKQIKIGKKKILFSRQCWIPAVLKATVQLFISCVLTGACRKTLQNELLYLNILVLECQRQSYEKA